jgi:hypothetical protein
MLMMEFIFLRRMCHSDRQDEVISQTDNDFSIASNHEKPVDVLAVWSTRLMAVRQLIAFSN